MNNVVAQFVFGSQRLFETEDEETRCLDSTQTDPSTGIPRIQSRNNKPSPYVSEFEDIVNQINDFELDLLSEQERKALTAFQHLQYCSRYILIRLSLRKVGKYHTSLQKYVSEVGEQGIKVAREEICRPVDDILERAQNVKVEEEDKMKVEETEVIDLTSDDEGEPSTSGCAQPEQPGVVQQDLSFLCENESRMTLDQALERLDVPALKDLMKECRVKPKSNTKDAMIRALRSHARSQGSIATMFKKKTSGLCQTQLNLSSSKSKLVSQEEQLRIMAVKKLGPSLRINRDFHLLLRKLDIIFYRSTSIPQNLFQNSYLRYFGIRKFASYTYARSLIWETPEEYTKYERALELQALVDSILDDDIFKPKDLTTGKTRFLTPLAPAVTDRRPTPGHEDVKMEEVEGDAPREPEYNVVDLTSTLGDGFKVQDDGDDDKRKPSPEKRLRAGRVVDIYQKVIKPLWDSCIAQAKVKPEGGKDRSLERFEEGYILTRLLWKTAECYALLHQFYEELNIIKMLLDQTFWRRAKRGKWYDRRALIKEYHLSKELKREAEANGWSKKFLHERKQALWKEAREGLYEALNDVDTHRVYRKSLVKRLTTMESRLGVTGDEHHDYEDNLKAANDICVLAERAIRFGKIESVSPMKKGKDREDISGYLIRSGLPIDVENDKSELPSPPTGKSIWNGVDGQPCNVETRALQFYASDKGGNFHGLHSETCILTTIFALLFWDIIFADVPGAFETAFQIGPLDLVEDSFYYAREEIIKARLKEIRSGSALEIVGQHDNLYRAQGTHCVGLKWNVCTKEELAEIVDCIGGDALAVICEIFCQDYPARASGVPDLVVWNSDDRKCKFVEVKGPGDRARDNQTLWFDALLSAGLDVDLCRVVECNTKNVNAENEKKAKREAKREREEKARIKKEEKEEEKRKAGAKPRKKNKVRVKEEDKFDNDMDDVLGPDDADYRCPGGGELSSPRKRRRALDEDDDKSILASSQDRVASSPTARGCSAESIDIVSLAKKRMKMDEEDYS
ncbi:hypothetical protein BDP27DRAFT_1294387 [Rhodocollybia butyracea]|uniref:Fanconi-associated nuclease n=1 Tax=Rhodocollybia butyracea TaxID=206335 RepID=A0A9P5PN75_9AGAR|nr:hypothetical protein BDP27DRAFT_1294387 [Rhodocollybia butyracea]